MTGVYIFSGIILFLFILSVIPITVGIDTAQNKYFLRYGIITVNLNNKDKKNNKKINNKAKKEKPKKDSFFKKYFKNNGFKNSIIEITDLLKCLFLRLKFFAKHIKFYVIDLKMSVACENAADTAILYGNVCTAIYPVISILENNFKIYNKKIAISSDFSSKKINFSLNFRMKTSLFIIISALIPLLPKIFKIIRRQKNE